MDELYRFDRSVDDPGESSMFAFQLEGGVAPSRLEDVEEVREAGKGDAQVRCEI